MRFRIDYVVPGGTRELGVVYLGDENLNEAVLAAGWAKPRAGKGGVPEPAYADAALAAEEAGIGLWDPEPGAAQAAIRSVTDGVEDAMAVKDRAGGVELPAIVEYIMDAGRMRWAARSPFSWERRRSSDPANIAGEVAKRLRSQDPARTAVPLGDL